MTNFKYRIKVTLLRYNVTRAGLEIDDDNTVEYYGAARSWQEAYNWITWAFMHTMAYWGIAAAEDEKLKGRFTDCLYSKLTKSELEGKRNIKRSVVLDWSMGKENYTFSIEVCIKKNKE